VNVKPGLADERDIRPVVATSSGLRPSVRSLLLALTAAIDGDQRAANGDVGGPPVGRVVGQLAASQR
jgi:hypothetical protein